MDKINCSCEGEITSIAWGSPCAGDKWAYKPKRGIKQIIIRYGGVVDSVVFNGDDNSTRFGGPGGNRTEKVKIGFPSEFLTGVSGTHGDNQYGYTICSIKFQTNQAQYGPFGTASAHRFSFEAKDGVISGFHGRAGNYLNAIGVYIKPVCSISTAVVAKQHSATDLGELCLRLPRSTGPWGGVSGGMEFDDGVFPAVKLVYVHIRSTCSTTAVSAVRFGYQKRDGTAFTSPVRGGHGVDAVRKIEMDGTSEFLTGIEGFSGPIEGFSGLNVITSLTFHTNKAKYGPIGPEIGTYFTSMYNIGKIVGFHGRSGAYLDAIGIHMEYL